MESESELLVAQPKDETQNSTQLVVNAPGEKASNDLNNGTSQQEPVRTEPVKMLEPRKRRLDRQFEEKIPEIHLIGEIKDAAGICQDLSEGLFLRCDQLERSFLRSVTYSYSCIAIVRCLL